MSALRGTRLPKYLPYLSGHAADLLEIEVRAIRARRQIEEAYQDALLEVRYCIRRAYNKAVAEVLGAPNRNG